MVVVSDTSPIGSQSNRRCRPLIWKNFDKNWMPAKQKPSPCLRKAEGHISLVRPLMDKLIREIKFRVSPALYKLVLEQVGE